MYIEELEENKVVEKQFVESQAMQKDTKEEDIVEARMQPSTKVQTLTEVQPNAMEINMSVPRAIKMRTHATIMDIATLLDKGICIPDPDRFMWIQTKQNYDKHVERMEKQKDIIEKEEWVSKTGLVILFLMNLEALMPNIMLEFLNTFAIKGTYIYFGYQDKVYVINK